MTEHICYVCGKKSPKHPKEFHGDKIELYSGEQKEVCRSCKIIADQGLTTYRKNLAT